ncbi:MAG TPA: hypothetical protein VE033_08895 [Acetobacteraceae bacterium]|jgi:hypothetical protein|nr:hypothetical protein [Acetobacteraceae bacterium]
MSDSNGGVSIAITPMHRTEQGIWESGPRKGAQFFLVELVQSEGEEAEVVVECRDERSAALAARVVGATLAALGLSEPSEEGEDVIEAFDEETATILADNETPEVEAASGEWRSEEGDDEDEEEQAPPRPS